MPLKPIVFGCTGMVGEGVLHVALNHPDVESVLAVGRRPCDVSHPKLKETVLSDLFSLDSVEAQLRGYNACFFCLGVSSIGMNEVEYTRITYDLTLRAATTLSRLNPDMTFCYVSGLGTDGTEQGRSMWARVKGRTENQLRRLPFKAAYAFRPGFINPIKGLKHAYGMSRAISPLYPFFRAVMPNMVCTLDDLGHAMINISLTGCPKPVLENRDIAQFARSSFHG
jgi:uncharacterized protein YbjT (DUF2867 family)